LFKKKRGKQLRNALRAQLKQGQVAFGVLVGIGSPEVSYALGEVGLDWITFDTQHSILDMPMIAGMIQAMSYSKTVPIVRVQSNDLGIINKALDIGAQAVVIPLVNTREDAEKAVRASKYKLGLRSYGGRATIRDPDYVSTADTEVMVIPQIETELALRNVEEIVTTDGIDAVFCGPFDLSMSLGGFRQFDSPIFQKAVGTLISACNAHGVSPGLLAPAGPVERSIHQGFKFISLGGDLGILSQGVANSLKSARNIIKSQA
jgi:2-keto-3-deoxy-L-rhamnonate aldolase RhmA